MAVPATIHEHAGHSHHAHAGRSTSALAWALGITIVFMIVEAVGGMVAHSLALLADAAHMLTDAGALGLSLLAAWIVGRPSGETRTFGWYRAEILAALANGGLLLAVTVGIIWEAIRRLLHPEPVQWDVMLGVASAGLVANVAAALVLHRSRGENLNVKGAYLHVLSDLAGSLAAMIAAVVIRLTGWSPADPVLSIALSALLLWSGWRLMLQAADVLLEAAPAHVDVAALETAVGAVPGVERVHDLHVWTVSSGFVAMSAHAVVREPSRAQGALDEITRRVRAFGVGHVTVQIEQSGDCVGCDPR